jgi:NADPH:quinone reductase-like Zn-dependent oxidoreductase
LLNFNKFALISYFPAGLNPVDAKFLYGDMVPPCCIPFLQKIIEGSGVGFDFMGTVIESSQSSTLKPGDCVFGTAPATSGSLASVISVPVDFCSMDIRPTPLMKG